MEVEGETTQIYQRETKDVVNEREREKVIYI